MADELVNVRYMAGDAERAVAFYTARFGFTVNTIAAPAFADVMRGNRRLLLSGPSSFSNLRAREHRSQTRTSVAQKKEIR